MPQILTPGRWRGLKTTSTEHHVFTIMAFDQRGSYEQMLPDDVTYNRAVEIKQEVVSTLSPHTSAVLLDPVYGLPAALNLHRNSGLLMALENTGYTGTSTYRQTEFNPDWTVQKIKKVAADAVKLLVYYHPEAGKLAEEIEALVERVAATCHSNDIPLFVEPISYSLDETISKNSEVFASQRPAIVQETARRFSQLGADILKLEFPADAAFEPDEQVWQEACAAVSEASSVPWVLLSAGVDFDIFERQVRVACQNGASGFLGGRAIWKEAISMAPDERQEFLRHTAKDRINRLVDHTEAYSRPWTDFYEPPPVETEWYTNYT